QAANGAGDEAQAMFVVRYVTEALSQEMQAKKALEKVQWVERVFTEAKTEIGQDATLSSDARRSRITVKLIDAFTSRQDLYVEATVCMRAAQEAWASAAHEVRQCHRTASNMPQDLGEMDTRMLEDLCLQCQCHAAAAGWHVCCEQLHMSMDILR